MLGCKIAVFSAAILTDCSLLTVSGTAGALLCGVYNAVAVATVYAMSKQLVRTAVMHIGSISFGAGMLAEDSLAIGAGILALAALGFTQNRVTFAADDLMGDASRVGLVNTLGAYVLALISVAYPQRIEGYVFAEGVFAVNNGGGIVFNSGKSNKSVAFAH